jgi:hypothetical protein
MQGIGGGQSIFEEKSIKWRNKQKGDNKRKK